MHTPHRLFAALLTAAALLVPAATAAATPLSYVALGDSYSAGTGTHDKQDSCYRSPEGYPAVVARARGWELNYQACQGAVVADVKTRQLGALTSATNVVTVTAGGNDAGFATAVTECLKPSWMSNCFGKLDAARAVIRNDLPARLTDLYAGIHAHAPAARVYALNYPRLFNGVDCNVLTFFSGDEMATMNGLADELSARISAAAAANGVTFVDVRPAFAGHEVCSSSEWVNNVSLPVEESYHPNVAGNSAYAAAFSARLGGPSPASAELSVREDALQRTATRTPLSASDYAATLPDLTSPANLAAAARAGIDPQQLRRLDKELRSGDTHRAERALRQLHALDAQHR